jgi:hypothetical protein
MVSNEQNKTVIEQENVNLWHGFDVTDFEAATESLLAQVDTLQRQFSIMKSILSDTLRRGTIATFTTSDAPARLADACDRVQTGISPCPQQIEAVQQGIAHWLNAERGSRRVRFEVAAKDRGWTVVGNWPEPVVSGIVFVVVDNAKERASVNGGVVSGLPTAEKLIAQAEAELRDLVKNKTEPKKFIHELWNAYRSSGGRINEGVLVFDLLREMLLVRQNKEFFRNPTAQRFRPYPVAQFRADLTGYLAAGSPRVIDGSEEYVLDIVGGSYAEHGLFMYFPETNRLATCGRLTFRPAQNN